MRSLPLTNPALSSTSSKRHRRNRAIGASALQCEWSNAAKARPNVACGLGAGGWPKGRSTHAQFGIHFHPATRSRESRSNALSPNSSDRVSMAAGAESAAWAASSRTATVPHHVRPQDAASDGRKLGRQIALIRITPFTEVAAGFM